MAATSRPRTGLGPAITRELSDRQGARISLSSRSVADDPARHDTTFFLTFRAQGAGRPALESAA